MGASPEAGPFPLATGQIRTPDGVSDVVSRTNPRVAHGCGYIPVADESPDAVNEVTQLGTGISPAAVNGGERGVQLGQQSILLSSS